MKAFIVILFSLTCSIAYALERTHPTGKNGPLIRREGYSLQYNHECRIPHWVSYLMKDTDLIKNVKRTNDFREDKDLKGPQASLKDYKRSGYDRGHLARAGLFTKSKKVMSETFILSNIIPQDSYMNQTGAWRKLEDFEYDSIKSFGEVMIVSGPVTGPNMQRIGENEVCVPNAVYKVLYKEKPKPSAIAFIIPNYRTSLPFTAYAVTVDELEEITGIDFLHELNDSIEKKVESKFDFTDWTISERVFLL